MHRSVAGRYREIHQSVTKADHCLKKKNSSENDEFFWAGFQNSSPVHAIKIEVFLKIIII